MKNETSRKPAGNQKNEERTVNKEQRTMNKEQRRNQQERRMKPARKKNETSIEVETRSSRKGPEMAPHYFF